MLLLLPDGTELPVAELPGSGPWTFLVLQPVPEPPRAVAELTRFGRVVVPDLRGRPGLPAVVVGGGLTAAPDLAAVERLLEELGAGPGWSGIAPDAPPR